MRHVLNNLDLFCCLQVLRRLLSYCHYLLQSLAIVTALEADRQKSGSQNTSTTSHHSHTHLIHTQVHGASSLRTWQYRLVRESVEPPNSTYQPIINNKEMRREDKQLLQREPCLGFAASQINAVLSLWGSETCSCDREAENNAAALHTNLCTKILE